jgi:phospholipid/cholesterol/gamma-HCH transport system ATP-binding protein
MEALEAVAIGGVPVEMTVVLSMRPKHHQTTTRGNPRNEARDADCVFDASGLESRASQKRRPRRGFWLTALRANRTRHSMTPIVEVTDLVREFGGRRVLDGISFTVNRGDTMIIMGASGCGKSTLLRHIVGSMRPTSGSVKLFGEEITAMDERSLALVRRRFGVLFQSGALLQSLTVGENVALPILEHSKLAPEIVDLMVKMKLEMVGLSGFEDLKPAEISGGMKKRVGLARALALDPELLFSDEPTAGLDPIMVSVVDILTQQVTRGIGITAVVVTHDMTSAFRIGTRMIMLGTGPNQGKVLAAGTPDEIRASSNAEVQQFINGEPDGPVPLKLSQDDYVTRLLGRPRQKHTAFSQS